MLIVQVSSTRTFNLFSAFFYYMWKTRESLVRVRIRLIRELAKSDGMQSVGFLMIGSPASYQFADFRDYWTQSVKSEIERSPRFNLTRCINLRTVEKWAIGSEPYIRMYVSIQGL